MGNKSPAVPPPILTWVKITVLTPSRAPVINVEIEVWGLRLKKTGNANFYRFSIPEVDYDNIVAAHGNLIDVKARKPHFGPPDLETKMCTPGENHQVFPLQKGEDAKFEIFLQDAALNRFTDHMDSIPARALTRAQARDVLLCLHREGGIKLVPEPTFKHTSADTCDAACKVSHPMINEQVSAKGPIASVLFFYPRHGSLPTKREQMKIDRSDPTWVDARNLVGMYRLMATLNSTYQVTEFIHNGISGDPGPDPHNDEKKTPQRKDCHGQGRAIDFGGVKAGTEYLYVLYDWGMQPVYDMKDPETDPARKKRLPVSDWPDKSRELLYRLEALPPGGNATAQALFKDVYQFATEQYSDTSSKPEQHGTSRIGQNSSIMNADHFTSSPKFKNKEGEEVTPKNGREAHKNHIHMNIGPTDTQPIPDPIEG